MKAIILVGGEGTRMRPLTFRTPKPLLPIANVAFLERQIRWLKSHGVDEVTLSLGYLPDAFEEYFRAHPCEGIRIEYVVEDEPLGTAGAIRFAAQNMKDDFIVCNGDVLTELDLTSLVDLHHRKNASATIALTYVEDPSAFGVVPTHDDGRVIAFVEKPPRENAPSHWINAGTYVLSSDFLQLIPEGVNVSVERETFPKLLQSGLMYALESDCYWLDIGTPEKYLEAHNNYLNRITQYCDEDKIHEVVPGLYSDGEVVLGKDVRVEGTSLVGAGTVIGDNCAIRSSVLGPRCIVEDSVTISSAVLHSGVRISTGSSISASIVGEASDISSNVKLEEFTLIGAHEKIAEDSHLQGERVPAGV